MTKKLKSITRNGERTMAIELKIGTRGTVAEFVRTYTRVFLKDSGIFLLVKGNLLKPDIWAVHTKYGYLCSFDKNNVVTYMGDGIWDLRSTKEIKLTDEEKQVLSEPDKEF